MGIEAIALVKLTPAQIDAAFPAKGAERPGADGKPLKLVALEDAVLLVLGVSFDMEPDEAGYEVRKRLGAALDAHDDSHGILIVPDKARPRSKKYADAVDEVGDLGFWAKKVAADFVPKARPKRDEVEEDITATLKDDNTLGAQLQALLGGSGGGGGGFPGISPDMMAQAQAMLSSPDGANIFAEAQKQVAAMMAQPGGFDALAKGLSEALGAQGLDPDALKGLMPEKMPTPEEMAAMFEQGQKDLEKLQREDPTKVDELKKKFGDLLGGEGEKK
ncbi:MAG: hypothetical protein U0269_23975 [Polyangiales bacterium]